MSRQALLIGNSIAHSNLEKSVPALSLLRTLNRYKTLLENLSVKHHFAVSVHVDTRADHVLEVVSKLARQAAREQDLFLLHYFGHGTLTSDNELQLVHPGSGEFGQVDLLPIEAIETRIKESGLKKSIMLVDCCYSGALARTFQFSLRAEHCRISSTVPAQKAYIEYEDLEAPIGYFTAAMMDAFTDPNACVSVAEDRVTASSLFQYLMAALDKEELAGLQKPTMAGLLHEELWIYRAAPNIEPGYTTAANSKSAYTKIVSICRSLKGRSFLSISDLHRHLIRDPLTSASFKTLFKRKDSSFVYIPVKIEVVAKYVRIIARLGLAERDPAMRLTELGRELATHWQDRCNEILIAAIDSYLAARGATKDDLIEASRRVLQGRRVPSQQEVADRLALSRIRIPRVDVGVLLDLLGYAGILQISSARAYFPWAAHNPRASPEGTVRNSVCRAG